MAKKTAACHKNQAVKGIHDGEHFIECHRKLQNASKHKAMSYERMKQVERELEEQIQQLLAQAEQTDQAEDQQYGRGGKEEELPEEWKRRESRLKKIRATKQALEEEARQQARQKKGGGFGAFGFEARKRFGPNGF